MADMASLVNKAFGRIIPIKVLLRSRTGSDIIWVLGGNLGLQLSSFLISIILAHILSKKFFANFMIMLTCMEVLRFFSQFGLRMSTIRFASLEESHNKSTYPVLSAFMALKLGISITLFLIVIIFAEFISMAWLKDIHLASLLRIAAFNVIGVSLLELVFVQFNVKENFVETAKCNIFQGIVRLTLVLTALLVFQSDLQAILIAWIITPIAVCFKYRKIFYRTFQFRGAWTGWIGDLCSFSKWIFLAILLTIACNRLDFFMLNWQGQKESIADYGVALALATMIKLLAGSSGTVLLPKACKVITCPSDIIRHLFTIAKVAAVGAVMVAMFGLLGLPLIKLTYGNNFSGAYIPALILCIGYLLFLIQELISQIYVALKLPWLKTLLNAGQLIVLLIVGSWLIPLYLADGAAGSVLIMYFCGVLLSLSLCKRLYEKF